MRAAKDLKDRAWLKVQAIGEEEDYKNGEDCPAQRLSEGMHEALKVGLPWENMKSSPT